MICDECRDKLGEPKLGKIKVEVVTSDGSTHIIDPGGAFLVHLKGRFIDLELENVHSITVSKE